MNKLRGSYNRASRHIVLDRSVAKWVEKLNGNKLTEIFNDALDFYKSKEMPPEEGLPLPSRRVKTPYSVDDDAYEAIVWWAKQYCVVPTHVIRALFSKAYARRGK